MVVDAIAQMEREGKAALTDFPTFGQIGDDGAQAVYEIVAHQIVVHVAQDMGAATLVGVEVRHGHTEGCSQRAAAPAAIIFRKARRPTLRAPLSVFC